MKPYLPKKHITVKGLLLIGFGSILFGGVVGVAAYFISNLVYLIIVFPIGIGVITVSAYKKLVLASKLYHPVLILLFSIVTGLSLALAFYATPYAVLRRDVVRDFQETYQIDFRTASRGFDAGLFEETGSSGFIGFMKLRAREGDEFEQYVILNSIPIELFHFRLSSIGAWMYWVLESVMFTLPFVYAGIQLGKRAFSTGANDWYELFENQIGMVGLDEKDQLLLCIQAGDFNGLCQIMTLEEKLSHPAIEVYKQSAMNKKSDVLLSIKQTFRQSPTVVKRNLLGQWEVPLMEYEAFEELISARLQ